MQTFYIPNEIDVKRWIKEAVTECMTAALPAPEVEENTLLNRKEVAKYLRVSLPTLTDWIKRGLPSHKQRGRVYFMKSEVVGYIKEHKMGPLKFGRKLYNPPPDMGENIKKTSYA
jgi:excisionase family DNA binding protein